MFQVYIHISMNSQNLFLILQLIFDKSTNQKIFAKDIIVPSVTSNRTILCDHSVFIRSKKNNIWSRLVEIALRSWRRIFVCRNRQRMMIQSNRTQLTKSTEVRISTVATEPEKESRFRGCGNISFFTEHTKKNVKLKHGFNNFSYT